MTASPDSSRVPRDRVAGVAAVVGDGVEGRLRHGVDHAGDDQLVDVSGVGIGGVLDPGGCPQGPLRMRAGAFERGPAIARHDALVAGGTPAGRSRWRPCRSARRPRRVPIVSSRGSTSASTRNTKNEATDSIPDRSSPVARPLQADLERVEDLSRSGRARKSG